MLVIQNRTPREYSDEDVEVLQATAMVIAENLVSGAVAGTVAAIEASRSQPLVVEGEPISEGIALGHVVLHEPRIVVTQLMAENPVARARSAGACRSTSCRRTSTRCSSTSICRTSASIAMCSKPIACSRTTRAGIGGLREAVEGGLTAEAAVERVQNAMRTRMLRQHDSYWRERQRDLDDLSDRLLRVLAGRLKSSEDDGGSAARRDPCRADDGTGGASRLRPQVGLRGLVVEDGSSQSHVAIVAKALGIAAIGQAIGIVDRVSAGDAAIVDAVTGEVHLRPTSELISAYSDKVRFRARRQKRYQSLRDRPAITKDGVSDRR